MDQVVQQEVVVQHPIQLRAEETLQDVLHSNLFEHLHVLPLFTSPFAINESLRRWYTLLSLSLFRIIVLIF